MKIKFYSIPVLLTTIIFFSCVSNADNFFIPVPEPWYFERSVTIGVDINSIIETKDGASAEFLPEWLLAFLEGGIDAVEMLHLFNNKYVFIGVNKNVNFIVVNRWADFYSPVQDFPMLAAVRIENRMILTSSLYPDDEYGFFFERLVKNAYNAVYPGVVKNDTSWIKINTENDIDESINRNPSEIYMSFVLFSIDKPLMQDIIRNLITQTLETVTPSANQAVAVNRLRQNFFEGF